MTVYYSPSFNDPSVGGVTPSGYLKGMYCTLKITDTTVLKTTYNRIHLFMVPAGAIVVGGWVISNIKNTPSNVELNGMADVKTYLVVDEGRSGPYISSGFVANSPKAITFESNNEGSKWVSVETAGGTTEKIVHNQLEGALVKGPYLLKKDMLCSLFVGGTDSDVVPTIGSVTVVVLFTFN